MNHIFKPPATSAHSQGLGVTPRFKKATPVEQVRVQHCMETLLALRDQGDLSRVGLCRQLGHSTTTMSKVIVDLRNDGWVVETQAQRVKEVGRPQTLLSLVPGRLKVLVLSLEPEVIYSALIGLDLGLVHEDRHVHAISRSSTQDTLDALTAIVQEECRLLRQQKASLPAYIAIVLPGMTDTRLRTSKHSLQLGWRNLDVATQLEARTQLPVLVHNNTRAMGFAEFRHLRLHEDQPLLFVQARFGLGAAMVNGATPSHHGHYGVSELGHLPIGKNQFEKQVPSDGNLVSVTHEAYLRAVLGLGTDNEEIIPQLEKRCAESDPLATRLYQQTVGNLGAGLAVAVNLLSPRVIVLGGIYAYASAKFLDDLDRELRQHALPDLVGELSLQRSQLGRLGALLGGAIVAFDRLLRTPSSYHPTAIN